MPASHEISFKGRMIMVPSVVIDGARVVVTGGRLKTAWVHDEIWLEEDPIRDPAALIAGIRAGGLRADLFTFTQRLPEVAPRHPFPHEPDNVAAIPLTTYDEWWNGRLSRKTRQEVTRAGRMGIEVRAVEFDDELVRGITALFNETPFRQGRRFPHYGKDFAQVRKEVAGLLERSEFIGAYLQGELVGYLKLVYMGPLASLLNLVSMDRHYDKRPSNALMAKAVELCTAKGKSFLVYGKYTYGKKGEDSMTEFKRRNGFEQIEVPRYVVPLSMKGRLAVRLGLHRGLLEALPQPLVRKLLELRAESTRRKMAQAGAGQPAATETSDKAADA